MKPKPFAELETDLLGIELVVTKLDAAKEQLDTAEYSHNHGFPFKRGTSTVRTDGGNGACETVYLEDFEILRRGGGPWHLLVKIALILLAGGVVGWFVLPVRRMD
jgi:hypothetical protein